MDLNQLQLKLRPRNAWSACDAGQLLAREHYKTLLAIWFLSTLIPLLVISGIFWWQPMWIAFVFWLLKPLWERPLLYFLSRAVFNDVPTVKECIKKAPSMWLVQPFASVLWRRLSPSRSFDLPVILLEGQRRKARSQRLGVLHRRGTGAATWLMLVLVHLEMVLPYCVIVLGIILYPHDIDLELSDMPSLINMSQQPLWDFVTALSAWISAGLIAPLYIASGFVLYLNRRTQLEGWDIELSFRGIAENQAPKPHTKSQLIGGLVLALILVLGSSLSSDPAYAETVPETAVNTLNSSETMTGPPPETSKAQISDEIISILSQPVFHQADERREWNDDVATWFKKLFERKKANDEKKESDWDLPNFSGIDDWLQLAALVIKMLIYVVPVILIGYLIYKYRKELKAVFTDASQRLSRHETPTTLFGLEVTKESLPDDIPAEINRLLSQGNVRGALALMYRAALSSLLHDHDIKFRPGDTEGNCVNKVSRQVGGNKARYFSVLTRHWQAVAYGHKPLTQDDLILLLNQWINHFSHSEQEQTHGAR